MISATDPRLPKVELAAVEAPPRRYGPRELVHQAYLCAKGFYHFVRHPTSRETFTALSEALVRFRANRDAVLHMLSDPRVAERCRERYTGTPYDPAELIKYPPGSLGHELAMAMRAHGFDPEFYREHYGETPKEFRTDEEYLRFRVRQTHDIVHVLTGFDMTEFPGELGMQAFHAAQTRRPFSIALVGLGLIRIILKPEELGRTLHQVAKGLAMGYTARSLVGERFEDDWAKPVRVWRVELGLEDEASFAFSPAARDERSRSGVREAS
jgi:ubiquinone biosynthesis protein Coq4